MLTKLVRLAHEEPSVRTHLLPWIRRAAGDYIEVRGSKRAQYFKEVWEMFEKTYAGIGLILSSPKEMLKYSLWEIAKKDGKPVAFALFKETPYGKKAGLSGSDGSPDGKSIAKNALRTKFHESGTYGEVSHVVEKIVLASGAPVVCAAYVGDILGKKITPLSDRLHYKRNLKGAGTVTKIMVGKPKGIPTTTLTNHGCPLPSSGKEADGLPDNLSGTVSASLLEHYACMSPLELG